MKYYTKRKFDSLIHVFEYSPIDTETLIEFGIKNKFETLSTIKNQTKLSQGYKELAKINLGFFGTSEHHGVTFSPTFVNGNAEGTSAECYLTKDGKFHITPLTNQQVNDLKGNVQFGCSLSYSVLIDGKKNFIGSENYSHFPQRNPRTLIGQKADNTMVFVVVEGRNSTSKGVNGEESAEIMLSLNCVNAINADGGGSSEMIVDGKVVNATSDGSERKIGSALVVYGKDVKPMGKTIAIDIGHGNNTYELKKSKFVIVDGKVYEEHDFNSKVGIELEKVLKRHGFKTIMYQQPNSPEIDLATRINYYNKLKVDLVCSIHANAGVSTAKGIAAFYWHTSKESKRLADLYVEEIKKAGFETYGNGSRESVPNTWSDFAICRDTHMNAILTENGFMTNPDDFKLIFQSDKYIKDIAILHAKAICKFFNVEYKEEVTVAKQPPSPVVEKGDEGKLILSDSLKKQMLQALENMSDSTKHGKNALSKDWVIKLQEDKLTVSESIALLYIAKDRGLL